MVRGGLVLWALAMGFGVMAQKPQIITRTELTPARGYVGEPRRLSITVLSETYFTAPVDITNLKIDGAFLVPRQNTPKTERMGGNTYAGVILNFYVFPYKPGTLDIPSVSFTTQSPPPGDFRGTEVRVTTDPSSFEVDAVPPNTDADEWIVADNLRISERFDKPLSDLKVGDVITRTVTFQASNTLSEFIPEMAWSEIDGISIYPQPPQLENTINKNAIAGQRVERAAYLLEDSGQVVIPGMQFQFYHPGRRAFMTRTLSEHKITIEANVELGLVASMKDSLAAFLITSEVVEEQGWGDLTITRRQGMTVAVVMVVLWVIWRWRLVNRLIGSYRARRAAYRQSERYLYKQLRRNVDSRKPAKTLQAIYHYLDEVKPIGYDATLGSVTEDSPLFEKLRHLIRSLYGPDPQDWDGRNLLGQIRSLRQHIRGEGAPTSKSLAKLPFNPGSGSL